MRPSAFHRLAVAWPPRVIAMAALLVGAAVAHAVSISPVLVELSPSRPIASVTFTNPGNQPVRYQTRTAAWHQVGGHDRQTPSDDLIVAPPIADIPAGGTQIFRIALRGPASGHEQAYRLVFEDVGVSTAAVSGEVAIKMHVNHDLPVFVLAAGQPKARLQLGACPGKPACVRIDNTGERYAQLKSLHLQRGAWQSDLTVNARILAGAWRQWDLVLPPGGAGPIGVRTTTRDGTVGTELPGPSR